MHTPAGSEHDDELVDRLLERLEGLAHKNRTATFNELVAEDDELSKLLAQDPELAARLQDQLAVLRHMGGLLSTMPMDCDGLSTRGYEVLGRLGYGGAGVVYRARQLSLGREVALKVMLGGRFASDRARQRFRREAETAARLQHPHIAQVYDHGEFDGLPYLSQELVPGGSLAERIERDPLTPQEVARLMESLARAVHYAHQCGVVHRDLKPANVLLDDQGEPKIVDFGLAKAMDFDSQLTRTGEAPGTPSYMAPEQIHGTEVGPRTDVYGLGTILYEILVGVPPFTGAGVADVYTKVLNVPAGFRRADSRSIPLELQAIALKCLEKSPTQRYSSAAALADDLWRWSEGLPIEARPLGAPARVIRWAKRRPAAAALIAVSTLAAVTLFVGSIMYSISLASALRLAEDLRREAEAKQKQIERHQHTMRQHLYAANMPLVQKAFDRNNLLQARELLARHVPRNGEEDLRGFAWYLLDHFCNSEVLCLRGHNRDVYTVCYSPDGRLLATCGQDGTVRLWDPNDGRAIAVLRGHAGELQCVAFSPDGKLLASGDDDGVVRLWPVDQIAQRATSSPTALTGNSTLASRTIDLGLASPVWSLAFSRDGAQLAIGSRVSIQIHDLAKDTVSRNWGGLQREVKCIVFDASAERVFFATQHQVIAGDIRSGELRPCSEEHANHVSVLALAHHGGMLASADQSGGIKLWDSNTLQLLPGSFAQIDRIDGLAFSPDDKLLSIAGKHRTVELWDVATRTRKLVLYGHTGPIWSTEFSPDGLRLASASSDGTVRIWEIESACPRVLQAIGDLRFTRLAFSPNGDALAVGSTRGTIDLWNWERGHDSPPRELVTSASLSADPSASPPSIVGLEYSVDGSVIFSLTSDGHLDRWDAQTGAHRDRASLLPGSASGFCRAPSKDLLAIWDDGGCSRFWDPEQRICPPMTWPMHDAVQIGLTTNGDRMAVLEQGGFHIRLLRTRDGVLENSWELPREVATCMALSPDARWLVTGGTALDRAVHLWDLVSGREVASFIGHVSQVMSVAICPDGRTLASSGADGSLRLWDFYSRQELITLEPGGKHIDQLQFSRDGSALAAIGTADDGTTRVFVWSSRRQTIPPARPLQIVESFPSVSISGSARVSANGLPESPGNAVAGPMEAYTALVAAAQKRLKSEDHGRTIVTLDERVQDGELQVSCVVIPGAMHHRHNLSIEQFSRGVAEVARAVAAGGTPVFVEVFYLAEHDAEGIHLPPQAIEIRRVSVDEIGRTDDVFERFRRVHRWAKSQGYVGGFPTFDDEPREAATEYGAALIKPGHGTEVWVPLSGPALR